MQSFKATSELRRILELPRRQPTISAELVDEMTDLLKTPRGTMRLKPLQALALYEMMQCGGAFLPLDVGEGKTLISLLAPYVLDAHDPILLLPAHLIQKTLNDIEEFSYHWRIPRNIRPMSYQMLGLVQYAEELENYHPDLLILDESQKAKNRSAAVTRRLDRYMDAHPTTKVVAMTGTIMRKSLRDFAHTLRWCLKMGAPVPLTDAELDEWALVLDETVENEFTRLEPGALLQLCTPDDIANAPPKEFGGEHVAARRGFRRRLRETPGVVSSADTGTEVHYPPESPEAGEPIPLTIRALTYDMEPITSAHFKTLRDEMVTPDGWTLWEAVDVWRHSKELALGFHQIWSPRPPEEWRAARKAWFQYVRAVLSHSRTYDSPDHIAQACDAGLLDRTALDAWRKVKDTYEINVKAIWHDDSAINAARRWMQENPGGIVWTEHVEFAARLSEATGATYYGAKGLSSSGAFVDDAPASECIIVSVDANREGRNLQSKRYRNLIVSPEEGADKWQQLLGRTHRPGQTHAVTVDVFLGCAEHARAWRKAKAGALSIRDTVGSESKLLIANVEWPDDDVIDSWSGARWGNEE